MGAEEVILLNLCIVQCSAMLQTGNALYFVGHCSVQLHKAEHHVSLMEWLNSSDQAHIVMGATMLKQLEL